MPQDSIPNPNGAKPGVSFPPFRLDLQNECLWHGGQVVELSHRAYQVLCYLAQRPGRLILKREILDSIWPETHVTDGVLKVHVAEIRRALGDSVQEPKFIKTVHRRGYQFLVREPAEASPSLSSLVERQGPIDELHRNFAECLTGQTRIVFVEGEAGIGKSALIHEFLRRIQDHSAVGLAQGHSPGQLTAAEPFFPVLEALSDLSKQPGVDLAPTLRQCAPTWLAQLPWLQSDSDRDLLKKSTLGAAQGRMAREFAELAVQLTANRPWVLILEDLHWADSATVDLIRLLGVRQDPSRLLLICTLRPEHGVPDPNPAHELCSHLALQRVAERLPLSVLTEDGVAEYLRNRWPGHAFPEDLALLLHRKTGGNPLFIVNVADQMHESSQIVSEDGVWKLPAGTQQLEIATPSSLSLMLSRIIDELPDQDRQLIEAASVLGCDFIPAILAGALSLDLGRIEERCAHLARRNSVIQGTGEVAFVEGVFSERHRFRHELFRQVAYERLAASYRSEIHWALGEHLERLSRQGFPVPPNELARHFEGCADSTRAIAYLHQGARDAMRAYASREALLCLDRATGLLDRLPPEQQIQQRLRLLETQGLILQQSDQVPDAVASFSEMAKLAREAERGDDEVRALLWLSQAFFLFDHRRSLAAAEEAVAASRLARDHSLAAHAESYLQSRKIILTGWDESRFRFCTQAVNAARERRSEYLLRELAAYCMLQTYKSQYRGVCATASEGMALALEAGDAYSHVSCQYFKAWSLVHMGEWGEALSILRDGLRTCAQNDHGPAAGILELLIARMHAEASDFEGAQRIVDGASALLKGGLPRCLGLILQIRVHVGLGEPHKALGVYREVERQCADGMIALDWLHTLTLLNAVAEAQVQRRDLAAARDTAGRLIHMAALPGERTYERLGRLTMAEIDSLEGRDLEMKSGLARLSAAAGAFDTPLADWKTLRAAAAPLKRAGRSREAEGLYRRSSAILDRIAQSIDPTEPLRTSLHHLARVNS